MTMPELSVIGLATAFAAGAVSFLSPCVLPLVPGYVSFVAGRTVNDGESAKPLRTLWLSCCFVAGFTTIFVILGAGANVLNLLLAPYRYQVTLISGALIILFGVFTLDLWRPQWSQRELRVHATPQGAGSLPAYLLGMAFAFGWTPCIGPVLGAILSLAASSSSRGADGMVLLAVYSLGLGVPFVLAALFLGSFVTRMGRLRVAGRVLRYAAGAIMIAMGVAMMTGHLTDIAFWFLETFPALGRIG
jgi:cytochrome c-type biogenesis protein